MAGRFASGGGARAGCATRTGATALCAAGTAPLCGAGVGRLAPLAGGSRRASPTGPLRGGWAAARRGWPPTSNSVTAPTRVGRCAAAVAALRAAGGGAVGAAGGGRPLAGGGSRLRRRVARVARGRRRRFAAGSAPMGRELAALRATGGARISTCRQSPVGRRAARDGWRRFAARDRRPSAAGVARLRRAGVSPRRGKRGCRGLFRPAAWSRSFPIGSPVGSDGYGCARLGASRMRPHLRRRVWTHSSIVGWNLPNRRSVRRAGGARCPGAAAGAGARGVSRSAPARGCVDRAEHRGGRGRDPSCGEGAFFPYGAAIRGGMLGDPRSRGDRGAGGDQTDARAIAAHSAEPCPQSPGRAARMGQPRKLTS